MSVPFLIALLCSLPALVAILTSARSARTVLGFQNSLLLYGIFYSVYFVFPYLLAVSANRIDPDFVPRVGAAVLIVYFGVRTGLRIGKSYGYTPQIASFLPRSHAIVLFGFCFV